MNRNQNIIIIDSSDEDFERYRSLLPKQKSIFSDIVQLKSMAQALAYFQDNSPLCCIINFRFENGSALELLQEMMRSVRRPDFAIVLSINLGYERLAADLMQMGVQDYLIKEEIGNNDLMHTLKNALRTFTLQKQLKMMAHFDSLTGLLNRSLFLNRLEQAVSEAKRYENNLCLLSLDIDYFKQINDTYGHDTGDRILCIVAERIRECVRKTDSVARLGGDEFMILLPSAVSHEGHYVAQKLLKHIPQPIEFDDIVLYVYPSIGLANFPDTASDHQELLKQVDTALYKAKEQGRSQYVKFSKQNQNQWQRKLHLSKNLPNALKNQDVRLAFQPVFDSLSKRCISVEALVRWNFEGEDIHTEEIVHLINQGSMATPFHDWLFNQAIRQLSLWHEEMPDLKLSLNMPANLCHNSLIIEKLFDAIKFHEVKPQDIILEITEAQMMRHADLTKDVLTSISNKGVRVAIDDFGSGQCSLEYLADFPCEQIKINEKFFLNLSLDDKNRRIIEAVTALGHELGLTVVAEGVENASLLEFAKQAGCDATQGYWMAQPAFAGDTWIEFLDNARAPLLTND
ncbi:MAG: EAL domain-containing protein [Agarilytica sp.]